MVQCGRWYVVGSHLSTRVELVDPRTDQALIEEPIKQHPCAALKNTARITAEQFEHGHGSLYSLCVRPNPRAGIEERAVAQNGVECNRCIALDAMGLRKCVRPFT